MQHLCLLRFFFFLSLALLFGGCAANYPHIPQSQGHISAAKPAIEPAEIPAPVTTTAFVPPPKPVEKPQTYSVVVNEVPAKELLFALGRDTKQNIDIHPAIQGLVTLNAVNETLPAILDRIARQVNIRYKLEGDTLVVSPDMPYFKTYKVDYVNLTRNTTSAIGISGLISTPVTGGAGGGAQASSGSSSAGNSSTTNVSTTSNNNFWEVLKDNIRSILSTTKVQTLSAEDKATRAEALKAAREERLQQAEAVSRAGQAAPTLYNAAFGGGSPAIPGDVKDDVVVNPVTGTVSVLASEKQHALIKQYLDGVIESSQRQVLIEATIVEVTLTDQYQAGVDFTRLGNFTIKQSLLGTNLGTPPFTQIGYAVGGNTNITSTIKLLEQFGKTRVLSSPKLMALNNQTALLKVVDNIVYFSIQAQQGASSSTGVFQPTTFNTTAQTVPVGVVMSVTPQINENGAVSLTVRPTISRITKFVNDPNPSLIVVTPTGVPGLNTTTTITNPVPQIQTREMESVLQVNSGQTIILGGLMQDEEIRSRDAVPGLGQIPLFGDLFSFRNDSLTKTELLIFLRPTVVANPSLDSDELKFFKRFLPQPEISGSTQ
ncbi:MAG TPA: secretin N-terminal domain-containing protein [Burkholderiales bacterium]|nr:secretin N-terminal domain-containing protein [Burkholderiales bacterium]